MIRSTIKTFNYLPRLTAELEARTVRALNAAAAAGAAVATEKSAGISGGTFSVVRAQRVAEGFAAGIRARGNYWRIFDKGSLGKRSAKLKRNRRAAAWPVNRRGTEYTAHRGDIDGKGISPRNISNPARTAGRRVLLAAIRRF